MEEFFKNKFRVASTRLEVWNYGWPGLYFVTICTKNRECCLGKINNGEVCMSQIGEIVAEELFKTSKLRSCVKLDDFIIMPNHLHVIFAIEDKDFDAFGRDTAHHVSTERKFGAAQPKSLSSIVASFKSAVTNHCHKNNLDFFWQSNFYEHIIRDEDDYARIKAYIANNTSNWSNDRNNPLNSNYEKRNLS